MQQQRLVDDAMGQRERVLTVDVAQVEGAGDACALELDAAGVDLAMASQQQLTDDLRPHQVPRIVAGGQPTGGRLLTPSSSVEPMRAAGSA